MEVSCQECDVDSNLAMKPSMSHVDSQVYYRIRTGNTIRKRWNDDAQQIAKRPEADIIVIERETIRGVPTGTLVQRRSRLSLNRYKRWEEVDACERERDEDSRKTIIRRRVTHSHSRTSKLDAALDWEATFATHARAAVEPANQETAATNAVGDDDNVTIVMGRKGRTVRAKRVPGKKVAHRADALPDKPADYMNLEDCDTLIFVTRDPTRWDFPMLRRAKHTGGGHFCCKDRNRPRRTAKKASFRSQDVASY